MVDRMLIPIAVGFLHHTIILPKKLLEPKFHEGLRFTFLHELKHLKRHDNWWLLIESLVGAAYFFHPVIYWAKRKIHEEWEYICDSHVIQVTNKSVSYADFLLHEIWNHGREKNPSLAVPFIINTRKTTKRVYSILEKRRPTLFTKIRDRIAVSLIFLSFILIFLFSVAPSAHIKEDNPTDIIINPSKSSEEYSVSSTIGKIKEPIADLNNNGSGPR
jgi:beta-lactamase regulating signal transducer with metallopeptidase domain